MVSSKIAKKDAGVPTLTISQICVAVLGVTLAVLITQLPDWFYDMNALRADTKPFKTFADFYPFYLGEHSDLTNRRLHVIGTSLSLATMAQSPMLIHSFTAALSVGYLVCSFTSNISHGVIEGLCVLVTFLTLAYATRDHKAALATLVIGYLCAWVGHFMFEHNKPATFIYPAYSLLGDFKMWFQVVTGEIPGFWY